MTPETARRHIEILHGSTPLVIADCLRSMFVAAPGKELICADLANIEGRVLAYLAGEEWKLDAFRAFDAGTGPDIYKLSYSRSFNVPVDQVDDDEQRQVGKVQELSLGFQGGVEAFQSMAKLYGVKVDDEQADVFKCLWREAHPATKQLWWDTNDAAIRATENPGEVVRAGYVKYRKRGSFLFCQLPSGRCLSYAYPKIVRRIWIETEDGTPKTWPVEKPLPKGAKETGAPRKAFRYMGVDSTTRRWGEQHAYGGYFVQNNTQATARDLFAAGMLRLEAHGYPIVMHTHDDAAAEVDRGFGSVEEFKALLSEVPPWLAGCPVAAKGWRGVRYRKD